MSAGPPGEAPTLATSGAGWTVGVPGDGPSDPPGRASISGIGPPGRSSVDGIDETGEGPPAPVAVFVAGSAFVAGAAPNPPAIEGGRLVRSWAGWLLGRADEPVITAEPAGIPAAAAAAATSIEGPGFRRSSVSVGCVTWEPD
jgi:hypothetical protein